jgi:chemotaxis signal transduction protein
LDCVVEIIPPRPFTRLPGAGADVCGLVGVGGRVVTVFDLGVVLGLGRAADDADHRLLLLELGRRRLGAAVEDIVTIAPARIDAHDVDGAVVGTGHMPDLEFTALDPRTLLLGRLLAA